MNSGHTVVMSRNLDDPTAMDRVVRIGLQRAIACGPVQFLKLIFQLFLPRNYINGDSLQSCTADVCTAVESTQFSCSFLCQQMAGRQWRHMTAA